MSTSPRVLVTQPYVPAYRVPLFDEIQRRLRSGGGDLIVASGVADHEQQKRHDAAEGAWSVPLAQRALGRGRRRLVWRAIPDVDHDVLVTEFDPRNNLAWLAPTSAPVVLWGHGRSYTRKQGAVSAWAKARLARRAAHVMTYSKSGREFVLDVSGIAADRATAIGNSTDTHSLRLALQLRLDETGERQDARRHALFVGGLDAPKRIAFLLDAARVASTLDPDFLLTIVGSGAQRNLVDEAIDAGVRIRHLYEARGEHLAAIAAGSRAIWMPGRVGLVAVDALALGMPVFTLRSSQHAPEADFLEPGRELRFLAEHPADFAREALLLMRAMPEHRDFREDYPTISAVAEAFVAVLESAHRDRRPEQHRAPRARTRG